MQVCELDGSIEVCPSLVLQKRPSVVDDDQRWSYGIELPDVDPADVLDRHSHRGSAVRWWSTAWQVLDWTFPGIASENKSPAVPSPANGSWGLVVE